MSRNETQTCRDLIEPALREAGWGWDAQVEIGPGPVNLTGEVMYDPSQRIVADYLLRATAYKIIVPSISYLGRYHSEPPGFASSGS